MSIAIVAGGPRPATILRHDPLGPTLNIPLLGPQAMHAVVNRYCGSLEDLTKAFAEVEAILLERSTLQNIRS